MKKAVFAMLCCAAISALLLVNFGRERIARVVQPPCDVSGVIPSSYVIADLVSSTDLRSGADGGLIAANRHTYALFLRPDVPPSTFPEWYEVSKFAGANGPGREIRSGNWPEGKMLPSRRYPVRYVGQPGGIAIVNTGADYHLPYPIPSRSEYKLNKNEDFWAYENSDNDTICRQSIVVTSREYTLTLVRAFERDSKGNEVDAGSDFSVDYSNTTPEGETESTIRVVWKTPLRPGYARQIDYRIEQ